MRLQDKTIFISAAAQGIGRASAMACAAEGAHVFATDINEDGLRALREDNPKIETRVLDVRETEAVNALAAQLPDLDGVFNCAGFVHNGNIEALTEPEWDFSFDLNVKAMYRTVKAFLPGLLRRAEATGTASILNMASMASSIKGFPNRLAYGASKGAVIGFTKGIAADYVNKGLRANALCPGTVDTPSLRDRIAAFPDPAEAEKNFIARQPMGRLATVDDITPITIYLLSDESRFVSGQALLVDGGVTI